MKRRLEDTMGSMIYMTLMIVLDTVIHSMMSFINFNRMIHPEVKHDSRNRNQDSRPLIQRISPHPSQRQLAERSMACLVVSSRKVNMAKTGWVVECRIYISSPYVPRVEVVFFRFKSFGHCLWLRHQCFCSGLIEVDCNQLSLGSVATPGSSCCKLRGQHISCILVYLDFTV